MLCSPGAQKRKDMKGIFNRKVFKLYSIVSYDDPKLSNRNPLNSSFCKLGMRNEEYYLQLPISHYFNKKVACNFWNHNQEELRVLGELVLQRWVLFTSLRSNKMPSRIKWHISRHQMQYQVAHYYFISILLPMY